MKTKRIGLGLLILAVVFPATSGAIIMRHDKGFSAYLARESDYPQVFFLEQQQGRKTCVATLIDPSWAITAAHCLEEASLLDNIAARRSHEVSIAGNTRVIDAYVVHPNYDEAAASDVDLALLHFAQIQEFPIPVSINKELNEEGKVVEIVGWGYSGIGTLGRAENDGEFRRARNRIDIATNRLRLDFDDPRSSAAQELEGVPGLGDSGGPAFDRIGDQLLLLGIAVGEVMGKNFNEETQGKYGAVAVYERLSLHIDWIENTLLKGSPLTAEPYTGNDDD